jgi:hypothetical protein
MIAHGKAFMCQGMTVCLCVTFLAGVSEPSDVMINPQTKKVQYGGAALAAANSVCSVGHGGCVVLTADTFNQVRQQEDNIDVCHAM